jgi:hypothetical protein
VLSVEYKDLQFRALFDLGKLTHAKVGKVGGHQAVIEFASSWKEGIFVFIQRTPPPDLAKESCKITKPLEKLLLDAALAQDNSGVVLKKLPRGIDSILEKVEDDSGLLQSGELEDPLEEGQKLTPVEVAIAQKVWQAMDGLTTLAAAIRYMGDVTTTEATRAVDILLHYGLVEIPNETLNGPLGKFQQLVSAVSATIGSDLSNAFLRLALRDSIGYSGRARVFALGSAGEVGVDMAAARSAQTSRTVMINDLENWQVKYIEYAGQEIDQQTLLSMIREIHKTS